MGARQKSSDVHLEKLTFGTVQLATKKQYIFFGKSVPFIELYVEFGTEVHPVYTFGGLQLLCIAILYWRGWF